VLWLSTPSEGAKIGHKEQNSSANDVQKCQRRHARRKRKEKEKKKKEKKKKKKEKGK
jgi:hypothetical protein